MGPGEFASSKRAKRAWPLNRALDHPDDRPAALFRVNSFSGLLILTTLATAPIGACSRCSSPDSLRVSSGIGMFGLFGVSVQVG